MRRFACGFIVPMLLFAFAGSSFAAHTITTWPGNKKGAVSLGFDDGCASHTSLGLPALDARGLKGTFFIITRNESWSWSPPWDVWRNAVNRGHEIASHTMTHPWLTDLSTAQVQSELSGSKALIDANIPSQRGVTFSYPYGEFNASVASIAQSIYIASRGTSCGLNSEPFDFSNVRACSPDSGEDIYAQADAAEQQGKWSVAYIHSLDGGNDCWGSWDIDTWTGYLDYLKTRNLWVGTFGAAVKYIKERESATLSVLSSSSDQIVLSLTDSMDDAIYNQPLTVRSEVPSGWATASVQQGSSVTEVPSTVEGTKRVVYYDAVPDHGLITLRNPQAWNPQITALAPQFVTAGSPAFILIVSGNNFMSGSKVSWGGSERVTTFVSTTQLNASITSVDIATPGIMPITVSNPDGRLSNSVGFEIRVPGPIVIDLSPSWAIAGGPSFTLTVDGSNFINGSKVRWKGSDRTTSFISSTEVRASISAADIATAGTATVTVYSPLPAKLSSLTVLPVNLPSLSSLTLSPSSVTGGSGSTGTVNLSGPAPVGGAVVSLSSSDTSVASVPASVTVGSGATSATFAITTSVVRRKKSVTISSIYRGIKKNKKLSVTH